MQIIVIESGFIYVGKKTKMKVNFTKFRLWSRIFKIVAVKPPTQYKRRRIIVHDVTKPEKESFEMSLPFRIHDPERNLQILQDRKGNDLTKEESDHIIKNEKLNLF